MKKVIKAKVSELDAMELGMKILGMDDNNIEDQEDVETELIEKFGISMDEFRDIVSRLLPLIDVGTSPLTGERFKGFSDIENKAWLAKVNI